MSQRWWVYIVECCDGTFYTGVTTNMARRIRQHNGELTGGARYTSARRPVDLKYLEESSDRSNALKREYRIRHLPKQQKQQLIETADLSAMR